MSDSLTSWFAAVFKHAIDEGMRAPFIVVAADKRGSVIALRVTEAEPDMLVQHFEGGVFVAPVAVMLLDQDDRAIRVTLRADGTLH